MRAISADVFSFDPHKPNVCSGVRDSACVDLVVDLPAALTNERSTPTHYYHITNTFRFFL